MCASADWLRSSISRRGGGREVNCVKPHRVISDLLPWHGYVCQVVDHHRRRLRRRRRCHHYHYHHPIVIDVVVATVIAIIIIIFITVVVIVIELIAKVLPFFSNWFTQSMAGLKMLKPAASQDYFGYRLPSYIHTVITKMFFILR